MKKKTLIIVLIFGSLFTIVGLDYFNSKRLFNHEIYGVILEINSGESLRYLLDDYYIEYGQYPKCLKEIDSIYYGSNVIHEKNIIYARQRALMDPFAKNRSYYFYQPIYDKNTMLRERYILLSRGIDGEISNQFQDTVYLDDSLHIKDYLNGKYLKSTEDADFKYFDKYFGKKDYNLNPFLTTGRDLMEMQIYGCITAKQLIKNMDEGTYWKVACIKCARNNLKYEKKKICYTENGIHITFNLKTDIQVNLKQDSICILGTVKDKVHKKRIIVNNAFLYDSLHSK